MSTDYEIRCNCGKRHSLDDWRRPEQVAELIALREPFAAIGKHIAGKEMWLWGWDAQGSMFPGVFRWFAEHEGHEMAVFDEYGERWPRVAP